MSVATTGFTIAGAVQVFPPSLEPTNRMFECPAGHSNILFVGSNDGGNTWTAPAIVNPVVATDIQHVLPSLAIDEDPNDVHVTYYTQHSNRSIDLDMANSHD